MSARAVPVPEMLTIAYVVLTAQPLDRDDLVPLPERSLLRLRGSSVSDLNRMTQLSHQRLVSRSVGAGAARLAAEEARREAIELAQRHDGLIIDLQTPRIVEGPDAGPRPAAEWFSFEYDLDNPEEIHTHGLHVVGLPEIVVRRVPEGQRPVYDMVVVGLVHRLLDEWPEHDPVGPARVTLSDITAGYEGGDPEPTEEGVNVLIDYDPITPALVVDIITDPRSALF
ncbi:MAG: hypothetical protein QOJ72_661 [Nocardioidaceae bacterium]|jgi:hypothetical protein|nr:hypothetical protein [Nocardioidaceae bacterium]